MPQKTITKDNKKEYELVIYDNPKLSEAAATEAIGFVTGFGILQSLQIATTTTIKGKCQVKIGKSRYELDPYREDFIATGINAVIKIIKK